MSYTLDDMMLDIQLRVPLNDIREKVRAEAINEVKKSLKEANYEYDENMSIDDNIGSAMLGEFAKGYNKGYDDKCSKVRSETIDEFFKECRDRTSHYLDGEQFKYMRELMDIAKYLKEQKDAINRTY